MTFKINLSNIEEITTLDEQLYREVIFFTVKKMIENKQSVTAAESLTAGMFLSEVASVSGASAILDGGFVTYANSAKIKLLDIDADLVNEFGVVSEQVAKEMASQSRKKMMSSFGIGLTGVAGPDALENHSAGTVYIGIADINGSEAYKFNFDGDRELVRKKAVMTAFLLLKNKLN